MKRLLLLLTLFCFPLSSSADPSSTAAPDLHHIHRQRLIGSRAKTGMFHAAILFYHADPSRQLDVTLARQNAEEIARAADLIEANAKALQRELSKEDGEILADDIRGTLETCKRAKDDVKALQGELNKAVPSQEEVRRQAQVLFHLMKRVQAYHNSAEHKIGIPPTPDPPEP